MPNTHSYQNGASGSNSSTANTFFSTRFSFLTFFSKIFQLFFTVLSLDRFKAFEKFIVLYSTNKVVFLCANMAFYLFFTYFLVSVFVMFYSPKFYYPFSGFFLLSFFSLLTPCVYLYKKAPLYSRDQVRHCVNIFRKGEVTLSKVKILEKKKCFQIVK